MVTALVIATTSVQTGVFWATRF